MTWSNFGFGCWRKEAVPRPTDIQTYDLRCSWPWTPVAHYPGVLSPSLKLPYRIPVNSLWHSSFLKILKGLCNLD